MFIQVVSCRSGQVNRKSTCPKANSRSWISARVLFTQNVWPLNGILGCDQTCTLNRWEDVKLVLKIIMVFSHCSTSDFHISKDVKSTIANTFNPLFFFKVKPSEKRWLLRVKNNLTSAWHDKLTTWLLLSNLGLWNVSIGWFYFQGNLSLLHPVWQRQGIHHPRSRRNQLLLDQFDRLPRPRWFLLGGNGRSACNWRSSCRRWLCVWWVKIS